MIPSLNQALESAGLSQLKETLEEADVDMEVFLFLTDGDMNELGIKVGPRRKLLNLQEHLRELHGIINEGQQDSDDDDDEEGGDEEEDGEEEEEDEDEDEDDEEDQDDEEDDDGEDDEARGQGREIRGFGEGAGVEGDEDEEEEDEDEEDEDEVAIDQPKKPLSSSQPTTPTTPTSVSFPAPVIKTSHVRERKERKEKPVVETLTIGEPVHPRPPKNKSRRTKEKEKEKKARRTEREQAKKKTKQEARMISTTDSIAEPKKSPVSATTAAAAAQVAPETVPVPTEFVKNKDKGKMIRMEAPEVNADEIQGATCQGWLWKQGGLVKSWKKRWCVLKGPCFYYFPTPSKTRAKGMITLPSYVITTAAEQVNKDFAFQAYHPSARTYVFVANNHHDMQHWMQMMTAAAQPSSFRQPVIPPTATSQSAKLSNKPLPANAHLIYNIFDVRITRKPNEVIGLDIKVNRQHGTVVTKIHEGSPAAATGLIQEGDQIVKIDGKMIAGMTIGPVIDMMKELKESFVFSFRRL